MLAKKIDIQMLMAGYEKVVTENAEFIAEKHPEVVANIFKILNSLKETGSAVQFELDMHVRPSYVIMQGLLEETLHDAKVEGVCESVKCYIITPRMPTPLMRSDDKEIDELNMSVATDFADFRKPILENFLEANNTIHAIYCRDAREKVQDTDSKGLENYDLLVAKYAVALKDLPVLNLEMSKFPPHFAGALYDIDGIRIAIESRQVTQIDAENKAQWSIKIGESADGRFAELNEFLQSCESGICL